MLQELDVLNFYNLMWLEQFIQTNKGIICGGCFKNIFNKEKVKDIDIFFRNETDWILAVEGFDQVTAGYKSPFDPEDEGLKESEATFTFHYENDNVKAYKHIKTGVVLELCRKVFGEPKYILNQFDFTITKFAFYKEKVYDDIPQGDEDNCQYHYETKILCHDKFFEHLHLKRLVIDDKIPFPMSTFERVIRYARYGYMPCKETKIELAKAINNLSPEQIEVSQALYNGMD